MITSAIPIYWTKEFPHDELPGFPELFISVREVIPLKAIDWYYNFEYNRMQRGLISKKTCSRMESFGSLKNTDQSLELSFQQRIQQKERIQTFFKKKRKGDCSWLKSSRKMKIETPGIGCGQFIKARKT